MLPLSSSRPPYLISDSVFLPTNTRGDIPLVPWQCSLCWTWLSDSLAFSVTIIGIHFTIRYRVFQRLKVLKCLNRIVGHGLYVKDKHCLNCLRNKRAILACKVTQCVKNIQVLSVYFPIVFSAQSLILIHKHNLCEFAIS